jgi:AraC-like DNA-binding protein
MKHSTTEQSADSELALRIGGTMALPSVLISLGFDPSEVLAEVGLDIHLFDHPDNRLSYAARSRLIAHCVLRTQCQHLGLLIGQEGGLHSLGLVGSVIKYSPDVGTALRSLVRFLHLHVRGAKANLALEGELAVLSYQIYESRVEATNQIGDGAVATMFNIMKTLCGSDWKASEVRFAHREPENIKPFQKFFRTPLQFDTEQNAIAFPVENLGFRLPFTDPEVHRLLLHQIEELEIRYGDDFPGQVRSVLRTGLLTGHARSDQIASIFSIHSRTLNRRLSNFGMNFQKLVDEGRFEIARQMLENSLMEINEITELLDYADASAFTRAFRRWSGTTPAQWRENRSVTNGKIESLSKYPIPPKSKS